jgi:hypothetical protein
VKSQRIDSFKLGTHGHLCACGLPQSNHSPFFLNCGHVESLPNFMVMMEKPKTQLCAPLLYSHNPVKLPKFQNKSRWYSMDRQFLADDINNHFALFQLPGNWSSTKKCAPYFCGNGFHVLRLLMDK